MEGDFEGVIKKLSSGLASGGDMRFDIDGSDIINDCDDVLAIESIVKDTEG